MTTLAPPRPAPATEPQVNTARAILALGRVEGGRLVRHPLVVLSTLAAAAWMVLITWNEAPVLDRDVVRTTIAILPVGAAVFLAAHLAALRGRGQDMDLVEVAPTSAASRTAGLLVGCVWPGGLTLALGVAHLVYLRAVGGVWGPNPFEVLAGPLLVSTCGVLGVMLARLLPSRWAGPPALLGLVAFHSWTGSSDVTAGLERWLGLWVPPFLHWFGVPVENNVRPAGLHAVFVVGVASVAATVAIMGRAHRRKMIAAILSLSLATGGVGFAMAAAAARGEGAAQRVRMFESALATDCNDVKGIIYCAKERYVDWIPRWATVVEGVVEAAPPGRVPEPIRIVQSSWRTNLLPDGSPRPKGTFVVGMEWARAGALGDAERRLALQVAYGIVGLPDNLDRKARVTQADIAFFARVGRDHRAFEITLPEPGERWSGSSCSTFGQARAAVAFYLAAAATPRSAAAIEAGIDTDLSYWLQGFSPAIHGALRFRTSWPGPIEPYSTEVRLGLDMAATPGMADLVARHWNVLTDRNTTTARAAEILGLPMIRTPRGLDSDGEFSVGFGPSAPPCP